MTFLAFTDGAVFIFFLCSFEVNGTWFLFLGNELSSLRFGNAQGSYLYFVLKKFFHSKISESFCRIRNLIRASSRTGLAAATEHFGVDLAGVHVVIDHQDAIGRVRPASSLCAG
jgi:hypothetical protein